MTNERTRSVFPVIPRCLGRIPEELDYENATKLNPPVRHLFDAIGFTIALPVIFMVLYCLVTAITFFLEKGVATIRFSCSSPKQVTKDKNLEEECVLIKSLYSTDVRKSENNEDVKPKFKHKSQCFESEV